MTLTRRMTTWTSEGPEPPPHTGAHTAPPAARPPSYMAFPPGSGAVPTEWGPEERAQPRENGRMGRSLHRPAPFSMKCWLSTCPSPAQEAIHASVPRPAGLCPHHSGGLGPWAPWLCPWVIEGQAHPTPFFGFFFNKDGAVLFASSFTPQGLPEPIAAQRFWAVLPQVPQGAGDSAQLGEVRQAWEPSGQTLPGETGARPGPRVRNVRKDRRCEG